MRACRMCDPDGGASCDPGLPVTPYVQCDHVTPTDVVATARAEGNRSRGPRRAGRSRRPFGQALRLVRR
jgi:hypothetical protein